MQNTAAHRRLIEYRDRKTNWKKGAGLGASHQSGWTDLVAKLIHQSGGAPQR